MGSTGKRVDLTNTSAYDWEMSIDRLAEVVALVDTNYRFIRCNQVMADRCGVPKEELAGRNCFEVIHQEKSPPDFCLLARPQGEENFTGSNIRDLKCFGGTFDIRTVPVFDIHGELAAYLHVANEVTRIKRMERLIEENLALGEFALGHSMQEILVNALDTAEKLTGSQLGFMHFMNEDEQNLSLEAWSSRTNQLFSKDNSGPWHSPVSEAGIWADCVRERRPVIHNNLAARKPRKADLPADHPVIDRELTIPILRNEKVVAVMGVGNKPADYDDEDVEVLSRFANSSYDFAMSKRLEEALNKSVEYSRGLLDAIPDMIFRMSREGVYIDFKAPKEELYYQEGNFIGKSNRELTTPDFADLIDLKIRDTLESRHIQVFDYQLDIPNKGLRDFEARMVPTGPDEITAIVRDITDRKKTEKSLKKKIEELEWFNKIMIDRELKMIELKGEVNELLRRAGQDEKYTIHR